jgi:hypothetical protein
MSSLFAVLRVGVGHSMMRSRYPISDDEFEKMNRVGYQASFLILIPTLIEK